MDWRELRADFLKDAAGGRHLHAFLTNTVEDLVDNVNGVKRAVDAAIADASAPLDESILRTHRDAISRANAALSEAKSRELDGLWTIAGPSRIDEQERAILRRRFMSLATAAAKSAGLVGADATQEHAVQAWLHLLKDRNSPYFEMGYRLSRLFEASADMVLQLEASSVQPRAGANNRALDTPAPRVAWKDVEIRVLSDNRVQIYRAGKPDEALTFAEMGFGDGRRKGDTSIKAWQMLIEFADGAFPRGGDPKTEKTIQTIRRKLRAKVATSIDDDPVPLRSGRYEPAFKIVRSRADR